MALVRSGSDGVASDVLDAGGCAGDCVRIIIAACLFAGEAPSRERLVDTHAIALPYNCVAHCRTRWSVSHVAEVWRLSGPFEIPSLAKTRAAATPARGQRDQLRPSIHSETWRETV